MSMMDDGLGYSTHVSNPGQPGFSGASSVPGANMQVTHGVLMIIATAAVALVAMSVVFRKP